MLYSLVYVSSASRLFSPAELVDLLLRSQESNARAGLTGILFYKDGNFTQLLGGPEGEVLTLLGKLRRDTRHHGIIVLTRGGIAERSFSDWSMAFEHVGYHQQKDAPEYREFLSRHRVDEAVFQRMGPTYKLLQRLKNL